MNNCLNKLLNVPQIAWATGIDEGTVRTALASGELASWDAGHMATTWLECYCWAQKRWKEKQTPMLHPAHVIMCFMMKEEPTAASAEWYAGISEKIPNMHELRAVADGMLETIN